MSSQISYKPSYYNYPYEGENKTYLLYNVYTGALANILAKDRQAVQALLKNPNDSELQRSNKELFGTMNECGFIVEESTNELELVRYRQISSRFKNNDLLTFTLIPSRACNCRCVYCFEEVREGRMSAEDIKNLVQFTKNELQKKKYLGINITWYGGEPLMAFKELKQISEELIGLCQANKIEYQAQMVTNGYLLDEEKAKELVRLKVTKFQICLDGTQKVHDQRRVLVNGGPTFERIKQGILVAKKHFEYIDLRLNVDKDNADDIERLLQEDWLYGDNVRIRLGPLRHYSSECSAWDPSSKGFTMDEFYAYHKKVEGVLAAKSVKTKTEPDEAPVKGLYCGAQFNSCYAVTPGGVVYKCLSALNKGDEVGKIKDGKFFPNNTFVDWFLRDPSQEELCRKCKILPSCLGGCPTVRKNFKDASSLHASVCSYSHVILENWLKTESQKIAP